MVPLTRQPARRLRPYESRVDSGASGLRRASRLVANQVRTVSKNRIIKVLGLVSRAEEQALDQALRIQLALDTVR